MISIDLNEFNPHNTIKITNVKTSEEVIRAENEYLHNNDFSIPGKWKKKYRLCKQIDGIRYDILQLESENGQAVTVYFDISEFWGKYK